MSKTIEKGRQRVTSIKEGVQRIALHGAILAGSTGLATEVVEHNVPHTWFELGFAAVGAGIGVCTNIFTSQRKDMPAQRLVARYGIRALEIVGGGTMLGVGAPKETLIFMGSMAAADAVEAVTSFNIRRRMRNNS